MESDSHDSHVPETEEEDTPIKNPVATPQTTDYSSDSHSGVQECQLRPHHLMIPREITKRSPKGETKTPTSTPTPTLTRTEIICKIPIPMMIKMEQSDIEMESHSQVPETEAKDTPIKNPVATLQTTDYSSDSHSGVRECQVRLHHLTIPKEITKKSPKQHQKKKSQSAGVRKIASQVIDALKHIESLTAKSGMTINELIQVSQLTGQASTSNENEMEVSETLDDWVGTSASSENENNTNQWNHSRRPNKYKPMPKGRRVLHMVKSDDSSLDGTTLTFKCPAPKIVKVGRAKKQKDTVKQIDGAIMASNTDKEMPQAVGEDYDRMPMDEEITTGIRAIRKSVKYQQMFDQTAETQDPPPLVTDNILLHK